MPFALHRVLVFCTMLCALFGGSSRAFAAEVAVLEFNAYGVGFDDAALVSQGFRDAFLEDGRFFPLEAFDISDRLSAGREDDVSEARTLVGQARGLLDSGQASRALDNLDRALSLHEGLESSVGLRSELADALFFRALAAAKLGRSQEAEDYLVKTLQIYPDYDTGRALSIPSSLRTPLSRAKAARMQIGPAVPDSGSLGNATARLRVQAVVVGYVDGSNNRIYARLLMNSRVAGEVSARAEEMPPFSGDPAYLRMVEELLAGVDSGSFTPRAGSPSSEFEAIPTFEEDPPGEVQSEGLAQPRMAEEQRDDDPPLPSSATGSSSNTGLFGRQRRSGGIRGTRRYNRSREPVTEQWWFWTITAAVVVGGGAAIALAAARSTDGSPAAGSSDPNTYRVTIETSN